MRLKIDRGPIDRDDSGRDQKVLARAGNMPVALIRPLADEEIDPNPNSVDALARAKADGMSWGLKAVGADRSPPLFDGRGVTVAVLDTGIAAPEHRAAFPGGVDICERDFTGLGNGDTNGHGTHCADIIFGKCVDGVRIGIAPGIKRA
jgi:subtilisin family serine protease